MLFAERFRFGFSGDHRARSGRAKPFVPLADFDTFPSEWQGYRSSRLNQAYRVIYKVERHHLLVKVERVSKHDYGA
jgi:Txe/YoeB family toxin of Txe-Axe toxin-antitoxin module